MVWLGQCLVLATALRYVLFNPRTKACTELFSVSPEAPPPTMVQAAPAADEAILLMVRQHCAEAYTACFASAAMLFCEVSTGGTSLLLSMSQAPQHITDAAGMQAFFVGRGLSEHCRHSPSD